MTTFWFVRHARAAARGAGLCDEGRTQASLVAAALAGLEGARIHTSPLSRATATAQILGQGLGVPVRESALLCERADFGGLPGQSWREFEAMWDRCSRERGYVPPLGDSSKAAGRRIEEFVAEISDPGHVVAVTHGGVLADFLLNAFGAAELDAANIAFGRDPYSGDVIGECSITRVHATSGALRLLQIASAEHLST